LSPPLCPPSRPPPQEAHQQTVAGPRVLDRRRPRRRCPPSRHFHYPWNPQIGLFLCLMTLFLGGQTGLFFGGHFHYPWGSPQQTSHELNIEVEGLLPICAVPGDRGHVTTVDGRAVTVGELRRSRMLTSGWALAASAHLSTGQRPRLLRPPVRLSPPPIRPTTAAVPEGSHQLQRVALNGKIRGI
jgi:hypothetical protein